MVYDAFKALKTCDIKVLFGTNNAHLIMVPSECTSKCHPPARVHSSPFFDFILNDRK